MSPWPPRRKAYMKKNVVPLVVIALVVAVLSTGVFYGLIVSRMDGSSPAAATLRFVAAADLEKGKVLKAEDFRLGPAADPGMPSPAKPEDLLGRTVKKKVDAGQVITESALSSFSQRGLPSGIPDGMRAVTVHISDSSSVVQLLSPGDRVDVQALISRNRNGETDVELRTLLQNATVYNVSTEANPNMQGRAVLTVLSSPQEAERLSVADAGARLRVILRNQADQKQVPLGTVSLLNLGSAPKPVVTSNFVAAAPVSRVLAHAVDLEVSLIEVSADQLATLAPGFRNDTLHVSSSAGQQDLQGKIEELKRNQKATLLASSRLTADRSGEFSWKASELASMRVRIEPLANSVAGGANLRIQPETILGLFGTSATKRVDSSIQLGLHQAAIVGGLLPAPEAAQLREKLAPGSKSSGGELLLIIAPVSKK